MIKMIVTDLDGTLLNKRKQLSQKTIDTLIRAQEEGYRLVLATGRNYQSLKSIYQTLKMDQFKTGAIIGLNGAEIYCFDQSYYQKSAMLAKEECQELVEYGHRHLCEVMVISDQRVLDCISPLLLFCKKIVYRLIHLLLKDKQMNTCLLMYMILVLSEQIRLGFLNYLYTLKKNYLDFTVI